ncbi:MAG: OB-fold domain-containing protein, partial [Candidatus Thorarchaeota archaeon]
VFSQDGRSHMAVAKEFGFQQEQMQDTLMLKTGLIGSAHGLMMLGAALDQAKADDLILFANYGDGADAFAIRSTKFIEDNDGNSLAEVGKARRSIGSYTRYLSFRNLVGDHQLETPFTAIPLLRREEELNIRLHGKKCNGCGQVLTLALKVCPHCKSAKEFMDVRLSKKGKVVTYSQEYYYPTPDPPVTMAVVDLDGGGRILAQMTDTEASKVKVDMPVDLTFRRLHSGGGFVNYTWKCKASEGGSK